MRLAIYLPALAACLVIASCATPQPPPDPILTGRTQDLMVRTDPPGATCSVVRGDTLQATVTTTPGTAAVRRDVDWWRHDPRAITITCSKDGYLDYRRTFEPEAAVRVSTEQKPPRDVPPGEAAAGAVAGGVLLALVMAAPMAAAPLALAPAVGIPVIAAGTVAATGAAIANKDKPPRAEWAFRELPEFVLVPATFDSEASRDAFFAELAKKLEAARDAKRAWVDANCRFWPCKVADPKPCPDPVCERQRTLADALLASELARIPELRSEVHIVGPTESGPGGGARRPPNAERDRNRGQNTISPFLRFRIAATGGAATLDPLVTGSSPVRPTN